MEILFNGQKKEVKNGASVADIIKNTPNLPKIFAVEKNGLIIYKEKYSQEILEANDEIELVIFTGGG